MDKLKTTKVDNDELESLKQQALEIALRLNVIQNGSLLDSNSNVVTLSQKQKLTTSEKIIVTAVLVITVGGSIAATVFDQPMILLPVVVIAVAYNIYAARKKNKLDRAGVQA